jgi:chemotaxis protein methyltransferase CheR
MTASHVSRPEEQIPPEIISSPSLLFLYYRVEQILGIRTTGDALIKLNEYLENRCGASFIENPAAYERMLTSREQIFEISKLLTVNETYFFREGVQFNLLMRTFLPQLAALNRPIQICSAATSIGCEAYSIAMLLDYYAKNMHDASQSSLEFVIDAFDVSAEAVETAKKARYTANTLRSDSAGWNYILDSYLIPDGGEFIVSHEIREKVRFSTHNIMRGLGRQYDVIFFRNALIYFSSKNRLVVMDDLAESLFNNGLLFLGVSETSSVRHPLLANKFFADVFYFQKIAQAFSRENELFREIHQKNTPAAKTRGGDEHQAAQKRPSPPVEKPPREHEARPPRQKRAELPVDCVEAAAILEKEEGAANAKNVLEMLAGGKNAPSGAELAAAVTAFLNRGDFDSASLALSPLEKHSSGAVTKFLRGEYNFHSGSAEEAEKNYEEAAGVDKAFWPALYRLSSLAAGGNRTRYEYKIKKAIESLEQGKGLRYEFFIGVFSPDFFRRILERKLTEQ